MTFSHLIFDLDGTLTDPLPGMVDSINHALVSNGYTARSSDELAQFVGPPLEGAFSNLVDSSDNGLITELIRCYRERYLDTGFSQNSVYDGVRELLESLRTDNHRLGVCTSKPAPTARKILSLFKLEHYFEFVSGGDVGVRKSEQLRDLLLSGSIDGAALMIGDRAVDITAAKSNQLRSAGVTWGYGSHAELHGVDPDFLLHLPAQLTDRLAENAAGSDRDQDAGDQVSGGTDTSDKSGSES